MDEAGALLCLGACRKKQEAVEPTRARLFISTYKFAFVICCSCLVQTKSGWLHCRNTATKFVLISRFCLNVTAMWYSTSILLCPAAHNHTRAKRSHIKCAKRQQVGVRLVPGWKSWPMVMTLNLAEAVPFTQPDNSCAGLLPSIRIDSNSVHPRSSYLRFSLEGTAVSLMAITCW